MSMSSIYTYNLINYSVATINKWFYSICKKMYYVYQLYSYLVHIK
jgi:hypothetical protein